MSHIIKKHFFKLLPTSLAGLLIITLAVSVWQATPNETKAAAGDGATSGITLLDTNANGKIDRITFNIANPNGETWTL